MSTPIVVICSLALVLATLWVIRVVLGSRSSFCRGQERIPFRWAKAQAAKACKGHRLLISIAGLKLPETELSYNTLHLGSPGSGKTISLRLILQDTLPLVRTGSDRRAVVFDFKRELLPILAAMNLQCAVYTLHPFDRRGAAWNMARDIRSPAHARELATLLVPHSKQETQVFFPDAARYLLDATIRSWIHQGRLWDLRDLILATRSTEMMRQIFSQNPDTESVVTQFFQESTTLANILSTLATKLGPFETVAAGWHRSRQKVSLVDWSSGESIIHLGSSPTAKDVLASLNALLINRMAELTLERPDNGMGRTYFCLDEAAELGRVALLVSLLTNGRSKGAATLACTQSVALLKSIYGGDMTAAILGQLQNALLFRLADPEDAAWASKRTGDSQSWRKNSRTSGANNTTTTTISTEPAFLPSEFLSLPCASVTNGIPGIYALRAIDGVFSHTTGFRRTVAALVPPDPSVPGFDPRPDDELFLEPWNDSDYERLGLTPPQDNDPDVAHVQAPTAHVPNLFAVTRQ